MLLKNWCFWTVVLEKTLESPLDFKEIQPVHPKGDQSWIFIRRTDAEAETPILWPPDAKSWLIWKDPDAGKDWRQEEKGTIEDEMAGWHHRLKGQSKLQEWWWTGRPGVLQSTGLQRVRHDWTDWMNQCSHYKLNYSLSCCFLFIKCSSHLQLPLECVCNHVSLSRLTTFLKKIIELYI